MLTTEDDLDALFAEARSVAPGCPAALVARCHLQADELLRARAAAARAQAASTAPRRGWFATLGGWPALGTLAASSVLGVTVGFAQPSSLALVAGSLRGVLMGEAVTVSTGLDVDLLSLWES